ncbi:MAG: hypothetical protein JXD21_07570 [Candidatus Omnitrophica bacterium]|nr:hypothetical protein [Candidatus Omnitrophota bacterium]
MNIFWIWSPFIIVFSFIGGLLLLSFFIRRIEQIVAGLSDDVNDLKRYFHLPRSARTHQQRKEYFFAFLSKQIYGMIEQEKSIEEIEQYIISQFGKRKLKKWKEYIYYIKKEHDLNKEHPITPNYRGQLFAREDN